MKQLFAIMPTALLLTATAASVWAQTDTQTLPAQASPATDIPIRPQNQQQANKQAQSQAAPQAQPQMNTQAITRTNTYSKDAQPHGPPWYQVEVILFTQADSFRNEANLKSIKLAYPAKRVFLQAADNRLDPELAEKLNPEDARLLNVLLPEDKLKRRDPAQPQAFVPLDSGDRLLNPEASTLERSGTYQVLFHQAWMQPMQGARSTPWIIVQGGKRIGDRHELEGSLRFFMDSHLNVQTDLWRTRFGQPAADLSTAAPLPVEGGAKVSSNPVMEAELPDTAQWPELPPRPQPPKAGLPAVLAPLIDTRGFSEESHRDDPRALPYRVEDIDIFEHSQRINSRDLHYLDHPRLGMLVRVTPWMPPGMEAIDDSAQQSLEDEEAQIIDEMNREEGANDAPLGDDEARD